MDHLLQIFTSNLPLPLTDSERQELYHLEAIIAEGLQIFYAVGSAIVSIRKKKLYRETHHTFEDYCRERWNINKARAYQLMDAADVGENLSKILDVSALPSKESQARALKAAPPDQQATIWNKAQATAPNGKVTAKHIEQVIQQQFHSEPEPEPHAAPAQRISVIIPAEDDDDPACVQCMSSHLQCQKCCVDCDNPCNAQQACRANAEATDFALHAYDQPTPPPAQEHPPARVTTCNFCGSILPIEEAFISYDKKQCVRAVICRVCSAQAMQKLEAFHFYNVDRVKLVNAGLRVMRIDDFACVIKEYNGTGWKLFEKHDSKAALKRSVEHWAHAPNIIFDNHL